MGVHIRDTSSDKSFVTPVWNFLVVSPSTFWVKQLSRALSSPMHAATVVNTTTTCESTAMLESKWPRIELLQVGLFLGS